jgi:hypothetical protein
MSRAVTIGGLQYNIPDVGESNWGQNVSDALIAIAANISGGGFFTVVPVSSSPITVVSGRTYLVDSSSTRQLNLPVPTINAYLLVIDKTGSAATNNIILHRNGGEKIDGSSADKVLNISGAEWWLVSDGIDWYTISNVPYLRSFIASGIANQVLINDANGLMSSESALAISRGGTNSGTNLNGNRNIISSGGAIVESAAITASRALTSDANGIPVASAVTATELGYVSGVTSAIQTQLASLQLYRRNAVINGDARINQRVTAYTLVKDTYGIGPDRFYGMATGTAVNAGTLAQVLNAPCGTTGYAIKFTGVTITGTGIVYFRHRIESFDSLRFKNQAASFSCRVYQDTGGALNYTVYVRKANTADTFSAVTAIANSGQVSISSGADTLLKFENVSMGDCSNGIEIEIKVECGTTTTKNFYFTEIQMEQGSAATAFEWIPFAQSLQLCMRYFEKNQPYTVAPVGATSNYECFGYGSVNVGTGTNAILIIPYKVTKRIVAHTVTVYDRAGASGKVMVINAGLASVSNGITASVTPGDQSSSLVAQIPTNYAMIGCNWTAEAEL